MDQFKVFVDILIESENFLEIPLGIVAGKSPECSHSLVMVLGYARENAEVIKKY